MTGRELMIATNALFATMVQTEDTTVKQKLRGEIIELNMKLVPHILKKYRPYQEDDLQNGYIGLIRATDTYDASKGVPFPHYACLCIERELQSIHKNGKRSFEVHMKGSIVSIYQGIVRDNGEEIDQDYEDFKAQEAFNNIFMHEGLDTLYERIIFPCIDAMESTCVKYDFKKWKDLEMVYLFSMADVKSQMQRLTFTQMALELGASVQSVKVKHNLLLNMVKQKCIQEGIHA